MKNLLDRFEAKAPEIVFEWHDAETEAKGWAVINSLRGGAAGGGTRMRAGLDRNEVESLAKTMEVKFTVSGPAIGGAKSGIDFDPNDPRRDGVLARWFKAVTPLLKTYYGTGGDLNVDELHDVIPMTERYGLWHPQEGIVNGHFAADERELVQRVGMLRLGVSKVVEDPRYTPDREAKYTIADMVTGWGVAESVVHYYGVYGAALGQSLAGKRVIVQGWGNVGSAAAYYLSLAGARIVGIIDRDGGLMNADGFTPEEVHALFVGKDGNALRAENVIPFAELDDAIWDMGAEIFLPCAASRLVTVEHVKRLVSAGLELISAGANVPFADPEIFYGPTYEFADQHVAVIPDFIANCGMARTFTLLMEGIGEVSDELILGDVSRTIRAALERCHERSPHPTLLAATALEIALDQLV
ncbi:MULTISPECIES: Glu/Leu/Phe/Val dehydrogenase dimerization domain-containing protein [unclassified Nocardioides]|uniref:Glu/Leu/Phe/Val dehydrogenase dimerization domain-containing protein n=1 Tax=unclassified Nocardioides TaxID=2615069 RepID=UPI0007029DAD|nr:MULTISPECIES: Glu/Leu/Phe/Val dehydrogenase dimerization domain-containing protein [unclassified Nocardioides]KRC53056.1 amino acid dehydrogenase [Nocardioides sp. Root79]KRC72585.1 amino acid dehydrogenase [Nocardioides sp. Root240]